jgi:hypothetical protein
VGFRNAGYNPDLEFFQRSRDSPESEPCIPILGPPHKNLKRSPNTQEFLKQDSTSQFKNIRTRNRIPRTAHPDALENVDYVVDPASLDAETLGRVVQPNHLHVLPVVQRHEASRRKG